MSDSLYPIETSVDEPLLAVENLSTSFRNRDAEIPVLTDFSASIAPGEALGLVGESGCGKSTVALAIMRDLGRGGRITGGSIRFRGRELTTLPEAALRRIRGAGIAMVQQEPMASLNPAMKIARQLMEVPMIHTGASAADARAEALRMVEAVRLPDPKRILASYPHQLSGGQQQRIVIAMALMAKPALLILDEPTTALDVTVEAGIVRLIGELRREFGTAILFISHNLGLVLETCDRICVMYAGEAVETGPTREVFTATRHPYTRGLLRSIPLPRADRLTRPLVAIPGHLPPPGERPAGCTFGPRCDHFAAGRCDARAIAMDPASATHATRCLRWREIDWNAPLPAPAGAAPVPPGEVVLTVNGLTKYYAVASNPLFGGESRLVKANEAVSFEAREAETLAIVGESGCGKSTLARLLVGLETATAGTIRLGTAEIGGIPVERRDPRTVASIQMVFQNPFDTLNPGVSVGRQIVRTLERFGVGRSGADREARMLGLLDLVKLPRAFAGRMPRQLSGGQKQRIGIARAFAGTPRVVVADEPVSALDVSVQAAVTALLSDIQRTSRTTLVLISHDLGIVRYLADQVLVMYLGHVVEIGSCEQVFAPPYHPYTEALLSAAPVADPRVVKEEIVLDGDIPSVVDPPPGCPFHTRCPRRVAVPGDLCRTVPPPMVELAPGHRVKCHLPPAVFTAMRPVIRRAEVPEGR